MSKSTKSVKSSKPQSSEKPTSTAVGSNTIEEINIPMLENNETTMESKPVEKLLVGLSYLACVVTFPFSLFFTLMKVRHYERVVMFRNGTLRKHDTYGPGLVFHLPCIDVPRSLDLRVICYCVDPQEALTKDSLSVTVDAVVYYRVQDAVMAVMRVTDYKKSTQFLASSTLRNAIGSRPLKEILNDRPAVSLQVFDSLKAMTWNWGVQILRVEIKDISLPVQLQKAMAAEAESTRLASAKIKVAKAEIECNKSLQVATEKLCSSQWGMTLRYLQSLQTIAGDYTHTVVIPFSVETLKNILSK